MQTSLSDIRAVCIVPLISRVGCSSLRLRLGAMRGYGVCLLLCSCLSGQTPTKFEAASIKRSASSAMTALRGGPGTSEPGQLSYSGVPLRTLLFRIWKLTESQLSGPASIATERYDIVAKVPPGSTRDQVNRMIESLLVERLDLRFHRETRQLPIYALMVARGGQKLKKAEAFSPAPASSDPALKLSGGGAAAINLMRDKAGLPQLPPGRKNVVMIPFNGHIRVMARMQEMSDIVQIAAGQSDREIVVDKTGLSGVYDFTLEFSRDSPRDGRAEPSPGSGGVPLPPGLVGAGDPTPTFLDAIEQQLGLRLVPTKAPITVVVVDGFNKEPKGN
jgi:uncharacterized protein (TIGR03435 family)